VHELKLAMLLLYTFAAFGFCWGVGGSLLTRPIREALGAFADSFVPEHASTRSLLQRLVTGGLLLIECPACFGFWIGLAVGLLSGFGWYALALAFYTAGTNFLFGRLTGLIDNP